MDAEERLSLLLDIQSLQNMVENVPHSDIKAKKKVKGLMRKLIRIDSTLAKQKN